MPSSSLKLGDIHPGNSCTIVSLAHDLPDEERRRLLELGFFPGTPVRAIMASPLGNPVAYLVRGMTVALRRAQADKIEVLLDA